jgi:hypothetical protein
VGRAAIVCWRIRGCSLWRSAGKKRKGDVFCEFFIFCYSMSRYSIFLEKKLEREHR